MSQPTGLYTNIPQDDGLEFCREAFEGRTDKSIPTSFLTELLNICLKKKTYLNLVVNCIHN